LTRALLLLICPAVLVPQTAPEIPVLQPGDAAVQEYRAAWTLYQQGRLNEAIPSLKALIARERSYFRAYGTLVDAFERQQKLDEAEKYFRQLAANEPSNGMADWALARVADHTLKYSEAVPHAVRCADVAPELWPCYTMLGRVTRLARDDWREVEARVSKLRGVKVRSIYLQAFLTEAHRTAIPHKSEARAEAGKGLELARAAGDGDLELYFLDVLANMAPAASASRDAMEMMESALRVAARLGDDERYYERAAVLAVAFGDAGDFERGRRYWYQILPQLRERGLLELRAETLPALGRFEALAGNLEGALSAYVEAHGYWLASGMPSIATRASLGIADFLLDHGRYGEATRWYEGARRENQTQPSAVLEGFALRGIGSAHARMGEYLQALDYQNRAIPEFEKDHKHNCAAATMGNIGALYVEMGSVRQAVPYFKRALEAALRYQDVDLQEENLVNLGDAYLRLGDAALSVSTLKRALRLSEATTYPLMTSKGMRAMGAAENSLGHSSAALGWYGRALELAKGSKLPVQQAEALELMGRSYTRMGRNGEAKARFEQAIEIADAVGSPEAALAAERGLASLARAGHRWREAYEMLRAAISRLEQMRATVPTPQLRMSYLRDRAGAYEDMLDVLEALDRSEPAAGWGREAFVYAERARARAFLELLAESRGQGPEAGPAPLNVAGAQAQAGEATMIEYALGDRVSLLWVVTGKHFRMVRLPARPLIDKEVRAFRELIAKPPSPGMDPDQWRAPARHLWNTLLGGADRETARSGKWIVIPDGVLYYLPFETLISPAERCVLEDHTVIYAPSVSALSRLKQLVDVGGPKKELLAYGDPDFGTASGSLPAVVRSVYRSAGLRLDPLPNTRREVMAIGAMFPESRRKILLGRDATESSVKQEDLTQYRRLHFATHTFMDEHSPARSGVVLALHDPHGEDGVLRASEILKLKLDADLVVLSACRTGLGTMVRGEGLVGLTRAFLYAGASRVVVSLWEVADSATADLMQSFYAAMGRGRSPAEALRLAKARMLAQGATVYRHPYYWAPFVLAGAE